MTERTVGAKDEISRVAKDLTGEITDFSLRIHANPELGHKEHRAVGWCKELLESHGFEFSIVPGVDTAFGATKRGSGPGPTVGFLAEYDALPGVDHG
ncbi:MAG: hypothetical protein ACRDIC_11350 [bacterium]